MISSISLAKNSTSNVKQNDRTTLSQYDFLNLLITQMRFQNPLNPLDFHEMTSQLTQFGSLDALNRISKSFENLISYQASINSLQAANLIGKKVKSFGNSITVEEGKASEAFYQLSKPGKVKVHIIDFHGNLVRVIEEGFKNASEHKLIWDGKDVNGSPVPDGVYLYRVSAIDESGNAIGVNSFQLNKITGVSFENGIVYLNHKTGKTTMEDIITILE